MVHMSNRPKRHLGRRSPTPLRIVSPVAPPPRSILREVYETDAPGAFGVRALAECVGGIDALEQLDIEPLPVTPFDPSAVPAEHRPLVEAIHTEVLGGIEAVNRPFFALRTAMGRAELPPPFDDEYQVIAERILLRLAMADWRVLAKSAPRRTAAAIAWVAFRGSQKKRVRKSVVTADGLWRAFGVSNCTALATTLHRALGLPRVDADDGWYDLSPLWLPDARLLHSVARLWIMRNRTTAVRVCETLALREAERRPVQYLPGGKVQIKARPVVPFSSFRAPDTTGRHTVVTVFGDLDEPEVLGLTVPDARRLVTMLQRALDAPVSPLGGRV